MAVSVSMGSESPFDLHEFIENDSTRTNKPTIENLLLNSIYKN
jgi:hypothetical protein